jgi:hypothetical protein
MNKNERIKTNEKKDRPTVLCKHRGLGVAYWLEPNRLPAPDGLRISLLLVELGGLR